MLQCIKKLDELKITEFNLVDSCDSSIICSETIDGNYHKLNGIFTDGTTTYTLCETEAYTKTYNVDINGANYVICYTKDNINGLSEITVYVKNLQFDFYALPSYNKVHNKNNFETIKCDSKIKNLQK